MDLAGSVGAVPSARPSTITGSGQGASRPRVATRRYRFCASSLGPSVSSFACDWPHAMPLRPHDPSPHIPDPPPARGPRGGLAGLPFALARVDRSGTVVALSGAWLDLSGREVGASLGVSWDGLLDLGDVDRWRGMAGDLYEGRRILAAGELRLRRPDGRGHPVEVRCALHHGPTGPPDGIGSNT